jgi:hypothetical protein
VAALGHPQTTFYVKAELSVNNLSEDRFAEIRDLHLKNDFQSKEISERFERKWATCTTANFCNTKTLLKIQVFRRVAP